MITRKKIVARIPAGPNVGHHEAVAIDYRKVHHGCRLLNHRPLHRTLHFCRNRYVIIYYNTFA